MAKRQGRALLAFVGREAYTTNARQQMAKEDSRLPKPEKGWKPALLDGGTDAFYWEKGQTRRKRRFALGGLQQHGDFVAVGFAPTELQQGRSQWRVNRHQCVGETKAVEGFAPTGS